MNAIDAINYHLNALPYRQVTLPLPIELPSTAPRPPPMIDPNVLEPPGAMTLPSAPPPSAPMIRPVVPSLRRQ